MLTVITIAGFVLALLALGWQLYDHWAENTTRLTVAIIESGDRYGGVAVLSVRNKGRRPVRVITAGFDLPYTPSPTGEGGPPMVFQLRGDGGAFDPPGATYPPRTIGPSDSWTTIIARSVLQDLLGRPPLVTAFACTADGHQFQSRPTELWGDRWARQLDELEEAARRAGARPSPAPPRPVAEHGGEDPAEALREARRAITRDEVPWTRRSTEMLLDEVFDARREMTGPRSDDPPGKPWAVWSFLEVDLFELLPGMPQMVPYLIESSSEVPVSPPLDDADLARHLKALHEVDWRYAIVITARPLDFEMEVPEGADPRLHVATTPLGSTPRRETEAVDFVVELSGSVYHDSERAIFRWIRDMIYARESELHRGAWATERLDG